MIFSKIKNNTLFSGKVGIKIKFWKKLSSKENYFLNKIHLEFWGIKVFSYIIPEIENGECKIIEDKKALIEKSTRIVLKKETKILEFNINDFPKLNYNSYSPTGSKIGDHEIALIFLREQNRIDDEYPDTIFQKYKNGIVIGYGPINFPFIYFEIGDKIYDINYKVTRKDYTKREYSNKKNIFYEFQKKQKLKDLKDLKDLNLKLEDLLNADFKKRGVNTIKNLKDAKISALNYAKSKK
jgi:hypothetical protein